LPRPPALASAAPSRGAPALDQWEDVRYFLAVVRAASFSGAARALGADQSTVSRRIALLEQALGKLLFERGPRVVRQTPHGEALVAPALAVERAVLALEDAARRTEDAPVGRVRIALTEGLAQHVVVPAVLPALFAAHPGLAVDLRTGDDVADLERHEADLALRFFRPPRGELVAQRVARLPLAVLAAKAQRRRLARTAARDLPWTAYVHERIDTPEARVLAQIGVSRARLECSSVETQLAAVRAGLGVAVAPRALTRVLAGLVELTPPDLPSLGALELFVVTRAALRHVPRVAVVYEALVCALRPLDERAPQNNGSREALRVLQRSASRQEIEHGTAR
jgi:DNA-binding transcriptional LysR family regulator